MFASVARRADERGSLVLRDCPCALTLKVFRIAFVQIRSAHWVGTWCIVL